MAPTKTVTRRSTRSSAASKTALSSVGNATNIPVKDRNAKKPAVKRKNQTLEKKSVPQKKKVKKDLTVNASDDPSIASNDISTKTLKFRGVVPVDDECKQCYENYHVYATGENVYNAMLNQTNVGQNNNKYYLLQVLEHNFKSDYVVWFRWGRVGKIAGTTLQNLPLNKAIAAFEKKFQDKTKNQWADRKNFTKYAQKYDLLEIDYGKDAEVENNVKKTVVNKIESKLDPKVQAVMNLLFNISEFEESVKEMQYDIKKAPLGKLTEVQIKAGYKSLKKVELCLQKGDFGKNMVDACSEFYTRIPHDFGMKRPPLIRSPQEMKLKLHLLEALSDIKVAISIIDDAEKSQAQESSVDTHYRSLDCSLSPLLSNADEYKIIEQYLTNTHASTHSSYSLQIEALFDLKKPGGEKKFMKDIGNRVLLWHGSRLTNWCGILKQGLRIAPPEAPVTGYMFGKGVYFADMVSKSANYCFATSRQPVGFLILCEVALGSMNEKSYADYAADKLPSGKHSTKGLGKTIPNPKKTLTMEDGTVVPLGEPISCSSNQQSALLYNEYVVYDVKQILPRYLVQVKFVFKKSW